MRTTLLLGDCLEKMAEMEPESVDAIATDPPYNLSDSGKRDQECLRHVLIEIGLPRYEKRDAEIVEGIDLSAPSSSRPQLRGVDGAIGIDPGIGVPEGAVYFESSPIGEKEVEYGAVTAEGVTDRDGTSMSDSEDGESLRNFVLQVADDRHTPFCDATCRCFTEPGAGFIAVVVAASGASGRYLFGGNPSDDTGGARRGDSHVGLSNDSRSEASGPRRVLAEGGTEVIAVLRLDLTRRTGELRLAHTADERDPLFELVLTEEVGALPRTCGLPSPTQPYQVSVIGGAADRTFTLNFPHSAKNTRSVGGFMGRTWDGWDSPAAFERWCSAWGREALRVLKPGGHALVFGGTRTYHRLTCGLEDAGFEIRDCLAWMFGSGFPKSLDISKAIDRSEGAEREITGRRTGAGNGSVIGLGSERSMETIYDATDEPATPEARSWQGWGTALKPAHEPIVLARKPFAGTVGANVQKHGTGALNIDATRILFASAEDQAAAAAAAARLTADQNAGRNAYGRFENGPASLQPYLDGLDKGRWPANVLLDEEAAELVDEQSGASASTSASMPLPIRPGDARGEDHGTRGIFRDCVLDSGEW